MNIESKKLELQQRIDFFTHKRDYHRTRLEQLRDPEFVKALIKEKIEREQSKIDLIDRKLQSHQRKLRNISEREKNPSMCPVCVKPMLVGQQLSTLGNDSPLPPDPVTGRVVVHKECREKAKDIYDMDVEYTTTKIVDGREMTNTYTKKVRVNPHDSTNKSVIHGVMKDNPVQDVIDYLDNVDTEDLRGFTKVVADTVIRHGKNILKNISTEQ